MSDYLTSLVDRERGRADAMVPRLLSRYEPPPREAGADGEWSQADEVVEARAPRNDSRQRRDVGGVAAGAPRASTPDHAAASTRTDVDAEKSRVAMTEPPAPLTLTKAAERAHASEERGIERVRAVANVDPDARLAGDSARVRRIAFSQSSAADLGAEDGTTGAPISPPDTARRTGIPRAEPPPPSNPERRSTAIPIAISIAAHSAADEQPASSAEFTPSRRAGANGRDAMIVRGERLRDDDSAVREALAIPSGPTIHVTIGRVEVRAVATPVPTTRPHATRQAMSLDEYLLQRNQGSRR